jgi:hypothetical protein
MEAVRRGAARWGVVAFPSLTAISVGTRLPVLGSRLTALPDVVHGVVPEPVQRIAAGVAEWLDHHDQLEPARCRGPRAPTPTLRGSMGELQVWRTGRNASTHSRIAFGPASAEQDAGMLGIRQ